MWGGSCVHGWDYHSKSVCYSWVKAIVFSQCLGLSLFMDKRMLRGKWFSTCQSEEKDKRWEKREVRDRERENDEAFRETMRGAGEQKKGKGKGDEKVKTGKRQTESCAKREFKFSFGSSHSSSSREQFSPGNDSFYFCGVVCLTPAHRKCGWPSGPMSTPSLITRVTITTDEADLQRWQHRDVNFASASSTVAVWLLHLQHINTDSSWRQKKRENHNTTMWRIICAVAVASQTVIV